MPPCHFSGWSQEDLARRLGPSIPASLIAAYESGTTMVASSHVWRIATALHVAPFALLDDTPFVASGDWEFYSHFRRLDRTARTRLARLVMQLAHDVVITVD